MGIRHYESYYVRPTRQLAKNIRIEVVGKDYEFILSILIDEHTIIHRA